MCCEMYNCCLCVSLETGCKVIGIIYTVLSITSASIYGSAACLPTLSSPRTIVYAATSGLSGLHVLAGLLLIYGAFWKKPDYLWPCIALSWFTSCLLIVSSMLGFILLYTIDVEQEDLSIVSSAYFTTACVLLYFSSIVNSRRTEILRGTDNYIRPPISTNYFV